MPAKKMTHSSSEGYVAGGLQVFGKLVGSETMHIDGQFEGRAHLEQNVVIGKHASFKGDLRASEVKVQGSLSGNVQARDKVELVFGAQARGDLRAPSVVVAEGVHLEGRIEIGPAQRAEDSGS